MLEILEIVQRLLTIEHANVLRLGRRELSHRPREVHEVRLDRRVHRMHSNLTRQTVRLASVAWTARCYDVRPFVRSAARQRNEVVTRERFAGLQLDLVSSTVLAAIAIAREQERVGYLAPETPRNMDEPRKTNDERAWQRQSLGADNPLGICFDDFCLSVDDQPQRSSERHHRKRLERSVQCETAYDQAPLRYVRWYAATLQYTPDAQKFRQVFWQIADFTPSLRPERPSATRTYRGAFLPRSPYTPPGSQS